MSSRRTTRARRLGSPTILFWLPPRRLEQAPPLAIGLTPGRRLDLAPPTTSARPVARIAKVALQNSLPSIFPGRDYVESGGLAGFGPNLVSISRRAAVYVDKIFKGAKPADLPVEQPTNFELFINLKTAKALGITIPPVVLARVDEVIE